MIRFSTLLLSSALLITTCGVVIGCAAASDPSAPTSSESTLPTSSNGLTPLSAAELKTTFTGKSFEDLSGSWTWAFAEDGLANSQAKDGSWEDTAQKWSIEGDKLCRSIKDDYPCVNIYKVGSSILFGKANSSDLETWAIAEK